MKTEQQSRTFLSGQPAGTALSVLIGSLQKTAILLVLIIIETVVSIA